MNLRIGVDYGGVCSASAEHCDSEQIDVPGCLETLRLMKQNGHYLVLISFCGAKRAKATREYLETLNVFDKMYFVKNKLFKNQICQYEGIDVMIDDRIDVLNTIMPPADTILFEMQSDACQITDEIKSTDSKTTTRITADPIADNLSFMTEYAGDQHGGQVDNSNTSMVDNQEIKNQEMSFMVDNQTNHSSKQTNTQHNYQLPFIASDWQQVHGILTYFVRSKSLQPNHTINLNKICYK